MSNYYQKYKKYSNNTSQVSSASSTLQEQMQQQKSLGVVVNNMKGIEKTSTEQYSQIYFSQKINLRANVVLALHAVQQGVSLSTFFNDWLSHVPTQDKGLAHELVFGTLRQWFSLKALILPLLKQEPQEPILETFLYVGAYQILCTRTAHHAGISETVEASKQLGYSYFSGVINAILRQCVREQAQYQIRLTQTHGLPSWLFKRLKKDWGEESGKLFEQLKCPAPLTLRINQRQISRDKYQQQLQQQDVTSTACTLSQHGLILSQSQAITQLFGFTEGYFSVQDEHAQLCGEILPDLTNRIVIDACSAPGGKLTHILEKYTVKQIFALDNDAQRLNKIQENLQRLKLAQANVHLIIADATQWQSPQAVDCILLDVPCSATGVIRRHPDIRLLRQATDIAALLETQRAILDHMWQQLKVGGYLLYMTCSLLKIENEQQMIDFFARHQNAKECTLNVTWGMTQKYGRQVFPSQNHGDGFYYCMIEKI